MYSDKTNSELIEILDQHSLLTFEAQLNLRDELEERAVVVDLSGLETTIANKLVQIKNLEYLKDFGFQANKNVDGLTVTRTQKAMLTDILAVIVGLFVFLLGVYGCVNLALTFINGDELDVFTLAYKFAMAALVFIGISFFSGLKRLFDFSGFELSKLNGLITLKKRFDVKLEEIKINAADIHLDQGEEVLSLKLGHDTIFTSNAGNVIQTLTLQELAKELKA
ncbi:hypothetical protein LCGC14_0080650 [marine sediment metagenome]|uniref:Uncharacterized protein n=1 Tax=marine sediment metagenome TaxID=412755 RepID=A0A0F9YJK8_9ZZZZ|nr:hypothetical protein [Maribacter sp.]HDZ05004.1 hypothetical protein [Maribacter sp.]HEA80520.1 hypothetical protein [Maribacter sp.]